MAYKGKTVIKSAGTAVDGEPTTGDLLPRVRRHCEYKQGKAGEKEAGHHQVKHVVEVTSSDLNGKCDVDVFLGTAIITEDISDGRCP